MLNASLIHKLPPTSGIPQKNAQPFASQTFLTQRERWDYSSQTDCVGHIASSVPSTSAIAMAHTRTSAELARRQRHSSHMSSRGGRAHPRRGIIASSLYPTRWPRHPASYRGYRQS